jgi:hypothetical protein
MRDASCAFVAAESARYVALPLVARSLADLTAVADVAAGCALVASGASGVDGVGLSGPQAKSAQETATKRRFIRAVINERGQESR